jgi:hypothetical protein
MMRLFTAAVLLFATVAPSFACEWNSAADKANETAKSASHNERPQSRS